MTIVQLQLLRRIPHADDIIVFCERQLDQVKKSKNSVFNFECARISCHFLFRQLQPRADYKHLLQYCIIFLGGVPPGGVKFHDCGPVTKTRFMGYALYCLHIAMFSRQFELSDTERSTVLEIACFVVSAYIQPWMKVSFRNFQEQMFERNIHLYLSVFFVHS